MPYPKAPQSQRDAEAAAVDCVWLAECISSKIKCPIRHNGCGYEWETLPKMVKRGHGCPKCAGQVLDLDERRSWAETINCTWLEDPIYMARKTAIKCNGCDFEWETCPKDVKNGHGCRKCNSGKFDYESSAKIYVVGDEIAYKVGITTLAARVDRLLRLARFGWKPLKVWEVSSGTIAYKIEQDFLKWVREENNIEPAYTEGIGASETMKIEDISLNKIIAKIEKLIEESCILTS
jgi:hypothetical protein